MRARFPAAGASLLALPVVGLSFLGGTAQATPPPIMDPSSQAAARVGVAAATPPGVVVLSGLSGESETLTGADIARRAHERVPVDHDGRTVVYAGPALDDLLRDVAVPFGNRVHGQAVNDVVFVTGRDRYRVVLTLPEVDPGFHKDARAILADQADGKPLDAREGPYRLVIQGDLHPSRSVHDVVSIAVRRLP